mmetsp:Transcript_14954/g.33750  ORF Transcript_14954/g.33750 Transcript_14954/m.33750 type:complete len:89 (-) Transcript_14954:2544-2810(-)
MDGWMDGWMDGLVVVVVPPSLHGGVVVLVVPLLVVRSGSFTPDRTENDPLFVASIAGTNTHKHTRTHTCPRTASGIILKSLHRHSALS